MIVPDYWAEAKRRHRTRERQTTVLRYGWSVSNQAEAQQMADQRADDALARILAGQRLDRRELKVAYNGADGMPIREEVLERVGRHVVTRNSYGAHCLNTPDGLFADIDNEPRDSLTTIGCIFALIATISIAAGVRIWTQSWGFTILAAWAAWMLVDMIRYRWRQWRRPSPAQLEASCLERVKAFVDDHPSWNVRIYRTPAGLRLLATHQPFEPRSEEVQAFFQAVGADPIYVQMCRNQNCFRARLTAKPWRIGIATHLRPRPGVWPVRAEYKAIREAWTQNYEAQQSAYASCHFVVTVGSGVIHDLLRDLIDYHDHHSRALRPDLPLA